jgi:hypothetical protein
MVALVVGRHPPSGLPPLPPAGAKPRSSLKGSTISSRFHQMSNTEIDIPSWLELRDEVSRQNEHLSGHSATEASVPLANGKLPSPSAKVGYGILYLYVSMDKSLSCTNAFLTLMCDKFEIGSQINHWSLGQTMLGWFRWQRNWVHIRISSSSQRSIAS